jgi:hypothetical protein
MTSMTPTEPTRHFGARHAVAPSTQSSARTDKPGRIAQEAFDPNS